MSDSEQKLYRRAYLLSLFTIFYNVIEGIVSMILGYEDETLSLFGFGADSFIEVMSGIGIAIMLIAHKGLSGQSKKQVRNNCIKNNRYSILSSFGWIACRYYSEHHQPS